MLSSTWITDITTDFEYKKYVLLAYLKKIEKAFNEAKIYPHLDELYFHKSELERLVSIQNQFNNELSRSLEKIDIKNFKLVYKQPEENSLFKEINEIIEYSIPVLSQSIEEGKEVQEFVEKNISIEEVGISPLYRNEGYLLLWPEQKREVYVYEYYLKNIIPSTGTEKDQISTNYIYKEKISFNTISSIKTKIIKQFNKLPNPATFLFTSSLRFPIPETLLPIAKMKLQNLL